MTSRPLPITVCDDGVPAALSRETRWVVWRYEARDDRWTKIPCQPSGRHAKTNDPATWRPYSDALAAYRTGRFDGVGFCLGSGWAGADLDHCRDVQTGAVLPVAQALVDLFNPAYCELSPSGTGLKLFFRADRIGFQVDFRNGAEFTPWQAARFFAVTGHGHGDPAVDRNQLLNEVLPVRVPIVAARRGYADAVNLTDDDLLLQMFGATNGDKCLALWRGDTSAYGDDHSRADLALCCFLAFWTNYDPDRVDRLFQRSGLMRPKWNTSSYRHATLRKAMQAAFAVPNPEDKKDLESHEDLDPEDEHVEDINPDGEDLEEIDPDDLVDEVDQ